MGDRFERGDHAPHAQVEHDGAQDHQRHGDLVQDAFEVQPAADDEGDHDGDQRQHDVQVTDDRVFHDGLFGQADDILGQEGLKTVAVERTGDGAEQRRNDGGEGSGEEGHAFHIHTLFGAGIGFIRLVIFLVPRPEGDHQQDAGEEDQAQAGDIKPVQGPVVAPVSKAHAEDHGQDDNRR